MALTSYLTDRERFIAEFLELSDAVSASVSVPKFVTKRITGILLEFDYLIKPVQAMLHAAWRAEQHGMLLPDMPVTRTTHTHLRANINMIISIEDEIKTICEQHGIDPAETETHRLTSELADNLQSMYSIFRTACHRCQVRL